MEPFLVVVILSCMLPMSVARVGWYPTADGMRPKRADTSEPACVNLVKKRQELVSLYFTCVKYFTQSKFRNEK